MGKNNNNNNNKKNNPNGGIKGSAKSGNNNNKQNNPNGGVKGSAKAAAAASTPVASSASPASSPAPSASQQIANVIAGDTSAPPWQSAANKWNPSLASTGLDGGYTPRKGANAGNRLDMNAFNNNSAYVGQAAIDRAIASGWTTDEIVYAMDRDNLKRGPNTNITSSNLYDMDSGEYGTWDQLFDNDKMKMQSIASVSDGIYDQWKNQGIDTLAEWWAYRPIADAAYRAKYPDGRPNPNFSTDIKWKERMAKRNKSVAAKRVSIWGPNDSWAKHLTAEEIAAIKPASLSSAPAPSSSSSTSSSSSSSPTPSSSSSSSSSTPSSSSSSTSQSSSPYAEWDFQYGKQDSNNVFEDTFLNSNFNDSDKKKKDSTGTSIYNSIINSTLGNSVVNPIADPTTFQSVISNF